MIFLTVIFNNFCKKSRRSHQRCSIKKAVLGNFTIFTEKHLIWGLLLIKLQAWKSTTLSKRDSYTGKLHLRTTASVNSWVTVFQGSLALPFKPNALTPEFCNLGELVQRTQVQTGSRGFYLSYSPDKSCKFRPENTCFVFSKKSSEILFFLILFSAGIYLLKVCLKRSQNGNIFFFFYSQVAYNCSN